MPECPVAGQRVAPATRVSDEFRRVGSSVLGERTAHLMKISHITSRQEWLAARLIDLFEGRDQLIVYHGMGWRLRTDRVQLQGKCHPAARGIGLHGHLLCLRGRRRRDVQHLSVPGPDPVGAAALHQRMALA